MFEDSGIACHQSRCGKAEDLPVGEVPGHDRQNNAQWPEGDIALAGIGGDFFIGKEAPRLARFDFSNLKEDTATLLQGTPIARDLRKGMLLNGVDLMRVAGFVSAAHTSEMIEETVQAFDRTIVRMQQEGLLA